MLFEGERFGFYDALKGHITQIHTKERPFKCDICSYAFALKRDLLRHMRTHTGEKPFQCDICNKSFSQKHNLTVHMRSHVKKTVQK